LKFGKGRQKNIGKEDSGNLDRRTVGKADSKMLDRRTSSYNAADQQKLGLKLSRTVEMRTAE
jgi:hypothetical protein